jgi:pimeloyl-ACP methyl ester carboxylesterase
MTHRFLSALALLAALCLAVAAPADAKPRGAASAPPTGAKPGTLLSYERIGLPRMYRAKAWRILYVTRDYKRAPILSTGIVVLPDTAPRIPMDRKFVAWGHPTTGIAWKCAPSLRASPVKAIGGLNDLVAGGIVVAATDYPGLGTEGPVGYLVGKGQAQAMIDSVRAAKQIPGVGGGPDFALWGYSQGGHAALFAAGIAPGYAPELSLKGVAAIAPPTDLATLLRANMNSIAGRILASFTLSSWNTKYRAPLDALVDSEAAALVQEVGKSCVDDLGGKLDALAAQKGLKQDFLKQDPARVTPWSALLVQNSVFSLDQRVPALIIQGAADDIVKPQVTANFVRTACQAGARIEYVVLNGQGHGGSMGAGQKRAVNWLTARLAGQPPHSNCRTGATVPRDRIR